MALPPRLQKYDGLLDLLVEAFMRELEEQQHAEQPLQALQPAGAAIIEPRDSAPHDAPVRA